MTRENINNGTIANDGTGDTLRVAAGKINNNFRELYGFLGDSNSVTNQVSLADSGVVFVGNTANSVLTHNEATVKQVFNLGDSGGVITINTATQTLTNKTLTSPVLTAPQFNDTSADHQYVLAVNELAADRTITLPLLSGNDEFVFQAHAQTLTNKTLTDPTLVRPIIQDRIEDSAGAVILGLVSAASAVNNITIGNAATGGIPQVTARGTDTNVEAGLTGQGNGTVTMLTAPRYRSETLTSSTAASLNRALTICNAGGAISVTLAAPSSSYVGQIKRIVNIGSSEVTVTPAVFKNGTSVTLREFGSIELMYMGTTPGWQLFADKNHSSSDADALFYVTA